MRKPLLSFQTEMHGLAITLQRPCDNETIAHLNDEELFHRLFLPEAPAG